MILFVKCVFIVFGITIIISYLKTRKKARTTETWDTVAGKILSSTLDVSETPPYSAQYSGFVAKYYPAITYEYIIDGKRFESTRIAAAPHPGFNAELDAHFYLEQFPFEKEIPVYVNPSDHSESVLHRGFSEETKQQLGFLMVLIIIWGILLPLVFLIDR